MHDITKAIEIAEKIYWVGHYDPETALVSNPYLLVDEEEAILIDPGSVLDYHQVSRKVFTTVEPDSINYIILHHQDPDICASTPRFEEVVNPYRQVITHSRAAVLVVHYGIKSPFYLVDRNDWELTMKSGRKLRFIFTPYLHFPGAFVTYDEKTKTLFTSDLFGGFSYDWSLYANDYYLEAVKAFHENYMPSKEILSHSIKKLRDLDIKMIAPQHGSIILEKDIPRYLDALEDLDCGDYLLIP